ncbi:MAG: hypothetical protein Q7V63_09410 [Gammaproteobacteria bacterium]|nr:hypothetical protein [Gammaproteobacteria bacterium]
MNGNQGAGADAFFNNVDDVRHFVAEAIERSGRVSAANTRRVNDALELLNGVITGSGFNEIAIIEARLDRISLFNVLRSDLTHLIPLARDDIAAVDQAYNTLPEDALRYGHDHWLTTKIIFYSRVNLEDELLSQLDLKISQTHDRDVVSIYRDKLEACSNYARYLPSALSATFIYVFEEEGEFQPNWIICKLKRVRGETIADDDNLLFEPVNIEDVLNECDATLVAMPENSDEIKAIRMAILYKMRRFAEAMTDFHALQDTPIATNNPFVFDTLGARLREALYYNGVLGFFRSCCSRLFAVPGVNLHHE